MLQELAAGILAPAMAEQTMLHVAECKSCGPILRQYLREFSEEQSPENVAILKELQSSKPAWQKKLVRELIGGGRRFRWLKLVPAMAALAAVIFGVVARAGAVGRLPGDIRRKKRWQRLLWSGAQLTMRLTVRRLLAL